MLVRNSIWVERETKFYKDATLFLMLKTFDVHPIQ